MKKVLTVLVGLALSACVETQPGIQPGAPYVLSKQEVSWVKRDVKGAMKDPDSARFGTIAASKNGEGTVTVCGYVNGRNSFGGYTGEVPFMGILTSTSFLVANIAAASATDVAAMTNVCRRAGISL